MTKLIEMVGENLRKLREERELSQGVMAAIMGVRRSALSMIENGKQEIYAHQLRKVCVALQVSCDWILYNEN